MTNDPSLPAADSAKKRRIFSPDRSMEDVHSPSKLITLDNQKGKGKRKEPNQQKEIYLTESESAGKAEPTKGNWDVKANIDNTILEALAKLKPMALLRKI
eukprot:12770609-Ditylum_brightwellii.AAC.1